MPEDAIMKAIAAGDLPGGLRKKLVVPEERLGLLVDGGEVVGQRGPGEHHLWNWPKPAPDVLLVPQVPFDLRPRLQHLRSGDRQHFDLVWPLTVQLEHPSHFCEIWLIPAPDPATALVDLEDYLAGWLWEAAQEGILPFALADLDGDEPTQSSLGRTMKPRLTSLLHNLGLRLVGSQRPRPVTLDEEREALEQVNQAARAARDARFEALFERLEDKEMLAHRLAEWSAEQGQEPLDPALVDRLWQVVDQGPEATAVRAQQAAEALERQVASLRLTLQSERTENERRFRQLMTRLEKEEAAEEELEAREVDPARMLKRVLYALRIFGTGLALLAALVALLAPQFTEQYLRLRIAGLSVTFGAGLLTLLTDLFIRRKVRQVRKQHTERKRAESRASLNRRREADRLVRARVEAGLKQVADNLEEAWRKGYSAGDEARELAVDLREVARKVTRFGEQDVRAANYYAGRYLAQDRAPDDQLAAVLDLDEDLLARSQSLSEKAEALFEQVNAGQVGEARTALRELENGTNAMRNRFTERGAYLMDPT
jgi:hypothetical protein